MMQGPNQQPHTRTYADHKGGRSRCVCITGLRCYHLAQDGPRDGADRRSGQNGTGR